jgi:hypothetical protein
MAALVKVLTADLRETTKTNDSEPLDTFLTGALRVLPVLVDRDTEGADWFTLLAKPDFGRFAKKSDQNDFVHTLGHCSVLLPYGTITCEARDHLLSNSGSQIGH